MVTKVFRAGDIVGILAFAALTLFPTTAALQDGSGPIIYVDSQIREYSCRTYDSTVRQCGKGSGAAVRSLAAAAAAAGPGMTVVVRGGVYREPLAPQASGTSEQPITFQGAEGESVVISGVDAPALQLIGRHHIVVQGFTVEDVLGWGRLQDATGNTIQRMVFRRASAGGTTGGLKLVRASGNRIMKNVFEDGNDNVLLQDDSNGNLVVENIFSRARHSLLSIRCSGTNVIRGNTFDNPDQKAMEIFDCEGISDAPVRLNSTLRNLVERNTFLRTRPTGRNYAYNAIQHGGQLTNVRRNVFTGAAGGGVNFQYYERESLFVFGNRLIHNTFYGNNCFAVIGVSGAPREYIENRVINNLLYKNRDCEGVGEQISIRDPQAVILIGNAIETEDPGFVNEAAGDLRLTGGSRLIDKAGPLTSTSSEGSGTALPVWDPVPFFDGFGIAGEVGDEIQLLGSGERARIVQIDLRERLLMLDRPLTWQHNQGVALAFSGDRPDPGAFEFEPAPIVEPPVEEQATEPSRGPAPSRVPTTSPFEKWAPPEGIPAPTFGIREGAPAPPNPWTDPTEGFFYVDATAETATDDGNPYGTPSRPRMTIPQELPAGSVVELRGTYDRSHTSPNTLRAAGTAEAPVFIRGASAHERPRIRRPWELKGAYVILENLEFTRLNQEETGSLVLLAPLRRAALRNSSLNGNLSGGGLGIVSWSPPDTVDNVVVVGNTIRDNGDVKAGFDQDVHGITVGSHVSHLWVVDNELARNSGDGIQINAGNRESQPTTHHIYVARNVAHHNKQTGFWTKQAVDVVFSQNLCYGHRAGNSSIGACMGMQYAAENVWFLFNHIHDSDYGIAFASDSDMGTGRDSFIVGNVIHDIHGSGEFNPNTAWSNAGIMLAGGVDRYVVNNTIHDVDGGINSPAAGNNYIVNNSITALAPGRGLHLFLELPSAIERSLVHHNLLDETVRIRWGSDRVLDWSGLQSLLPTRDVAPLAGPLQFRNPTGDDFRLVGTQPDVARGSAEAMKIGETYLKRFGIALPGDFRTIGSFNQSAMHPPSARPAGAR